MFTSVCIAAIVVVHGVVSDGAITVHGYGNAQGLGPAARDAAVRDAKTAILIERLELISPSRDFSEFADVIRRAPDYFRSCRTVRESQGDDMTQVEVEAELLEGILRRDLAQVVLDSSVTGLRVIIVVSERIGVAPARDFAQSGVAEASLAAGLKSARFDTIDAPELGRQLAGLDIYQWAGGSPEAIATLARDLRADVAVVGTATTESEPTSESSNILKTRATLDLRIVRASDGFVVAEQTSKAVVQGADSGESGRQAVEDCCDKVLQDVVDSSALGALGGAGSNNILVTIEGLQQREQIQEIVAEFKRQPNVHDVEELYASDKIARLRIAFTGQVRDLVDYVSRSQFSTYTLTPTQVVNRDMTLSLQPE